MPVETKVSLVVLYATIGLCWSCASAAMLLARVPVERVRSPTWVGFAMALLFWPFSMAFTLYLYSEHGAALRERLVRTLRQNYFDRPGLLSPQMPASHAVCLRHDRRMSARTLLCADCARPLDVPYCAACAADASVPHLAFDVRCIGCHQRAQQQQA
jgi:hypothetical protein